MPTIPLSRGRHARVDAADLPRLHAMGNWMLSNKGYAIHHETDGQRTRVCYMHRVLLQAPADRVVDHINGDKLDNRRANLRLATYSQNNANRRPFASSRAVYKGLSWKRGKWQVRIGVDGERIYLGRFADPVQAALMYDAAARHFFPDFHQINFPDRPTPPDIAAALRERLAD